MAVDRTLVQIRERSFLDVLDLALVVVRRRPVTIGLAALAGVAPWAALDAFVMRRGVAPAAWLPLLAMEAPWATAPLTVVMGGLMFGERPSAGRVLRTLLRALPPMLFYQGIVRACLLLSVILAPLIPAKLGFLDEVLLLERGRWRSVPGRSWRLSGEHWGDLAVHWAALVAFGAMFVTAFRWAAEVLAGILMKAVMGGSSWGSDSANILEAFSAWLVNLGDWRAQVGIWVAVSFAGVVRFLTYIDRRIRLEGWEVEMRLRQAGAAMEDAERW